MRILFFRVRPESTDFMEAVWVRELDWEGPVPRIGDQVSVLSASDEKVAAAYIWEVVSALWLRRGEEITVQLGIVVLDRTLSIERGVCWQDRAPARKV